MNKNFPVKVTPVSPYQPPHLIGSCIPATQPPMNSRSRAGSFMTSSTISAWSILDHDDDLELAEVDSSPAVVNSRTTHCVFLDLPQDFKDMIYTSSPSNPWACTSARPAPASVSTATATTAGAATIHHTIWTPSSATTTRTAASTYTSHRINCTRYAEQLAPQHDEQRGGGG